MSDFMPGPEDMARNARANPEAAEYHGRCLYNTRNGRAWADDPHTAKPWGELSADEREWWIAAAFDVMAEGAENEREASDDEPWKDGGAS